MEFIEKLINAEWTIWFIILGIIFFLLWLFAGGGDYKFIGLSPMKIGVDSSKYIDRSAYDIIENGNYNAETIMGVDITPSNITNINQTDEPNITNITNTNQETLADICRLDPNSNFCVDPSVTLIDKPRKNTNCSIGERICREVMEDIYQKPFPCVRPGFLKNPETNRNLELDCYNEELKIAVEYNGIQHYKWPNFTGHTKEAFIKQLRRDKYKIETCNHQGVYLINVPYNIAHNDIKAFLEYNLPENQELRSANTNNILDSYDDVLAMYDPNPTYCSYDD